MAIVSDLPEEILFMIFQNLDGSDLVDCQKMCRAWYHPAHILFLEEISMYSSSRIEAFLRSIDANSKPAYLNAVKTLEIYNTNDGDYVQFDQEKLEKLFLRFPNLKEVGITCSMNFLEKWSDELCERFLNSCKKIETFKVNVGYGEDESYCDVLYKLRSLVTEVNVKKINDSTRFGNKLQFLSEFPRLQEVKGPIPVTNFEQWLPTLRQLTALNNFHVNFEGADDTDTFAEKYLATLSVDEQNKLITRLAEVKVITFGFNETGFGLNSTKFVSQYMTGLKSLSVGSCFSRVWTDVKQRLFCSFLMDFVHKIDDCRLEMVMTHEVLCEYLPIFAFKIFHQPVSTPRKLFNRRIQLSLAETTDSIAEVIVSSKVETLDQCMNINVNKEVSLQRIISTILKKVIALNDVDTFILNIGKRGGSEYKQKADFSMYHKILQLMPSIREVKLDIPASYKESSTIEGAPTTPHLKVEKLTIRATEDIKCQTLLDQCCFIFPNLKNLYLYYFSGTWKEFMCEFQVELGGYSLDSLSLDITPLKKKMKKHFDKDNISNDDFFVVEVSILKNSERHLFRVPFNLTKAISINDNDLKGLTRGVDYIKLHISVKSTKSIELGVKKSDFGSDEKEDYLHYTRYGTEFLTLFDAANNC